MKKALSILAAAYLLVAACWALVQGATHSKDAVITGRLSCAYCSFKTGTCTRESCQANVKHGTPVVLTDMTGSLYVLISGEKEKPLMTAERKGLLKEQVTVHGRLVKRGGMQGIYVKTMEIANN